MWGKGARAGQGSGIGGSSNTSPACPTVDEGPDSEPHRRQQQQDAERIGDETGREQQGTRHEQECPVNNLVGGNRALPNLLVESAPDAEALTPHDPTPDDRHGGQHDERGEETDGVAHLYEHVELDDRYPDDQQEYDETHVVTLAICGPARRAGPDGQLTPSALRVFGSSVPFTLSRIDFWYTLTALANVLL